MRLIFYNIYCGAGIWIRQPRQNRAQPARLYFYLSLAELSTVMPWLPYPGVTVTEHVPGAESNLFSKNKFLIILGDAQIVRKSESKQKTQVKGILLFSAIEIRNLFDQFDFALIVSLTKRNYRA